MKKYFIHVFNVLSDLDKHETRTTKKGAERLANLYIKNFGFGTVVNVEDCNGVTVATYTK